MRRNVIWIKVYFRKLKYVKRKEYLDFLHRHQDKKIIKIVSGVRRSGKSTLFELFKNDLLDNLLN